MVRQTVKAPPKGAKLPPPTKGGVGKPGNALPEPRPSSKVGLPPPPAPARKPA
jgi:hypothetical protein